MLSIDYRPKCYRSRNILRNSPKERALRPHVCMAAIVNNIGIGLCFRLIPDIVNYRTKATEPILNNFNGNRNLAEIASRDST